MAAKTGTYTLIASTTLSTTANSIVFSSIPATYTDLILVTNAQCQTSNGQGMYLNYNADGANNYSHTVLYGNGTSSLSSRASAGTKTAIGNIDTGNYNTCIVNIQDYANTTTYKTHISKCAAPANYVLSYTGLWRSTAAISTITIVLDTQPFNSGSNFKLYGIEAAK
jgi:hypothetical protein